MAVDESGRCPAVVDQVNPTVVFCVGIEETAAAAAGGALHPGSLVVRHGRICDQQQLRGVLHPLGQKESPGVVFGTVEAVSRAVGDQPVGIHVVGDALHAEGDLIVGERGAVERRETVRRADQHRRLEVAEVFRPVAGDQEVEPAFGVFGDRRDHFVVGRVLGQGEHAFLFGGSTAGGSRPFPRLIERRKQHRGQNCNDCNHHQQFNQCKMAVRGVLWTTAVHGILLGLSWSTELRSMI